MFRENEAFYRIPCKEIDDEVSKIVKVLYSHKKEFFEIYNHVNKYGVFSDNKHYLQFKKLINECEKECGVSDNN